MTSVDLQIYGRTYMVACDPGEEERVRALGRMVDERARNLGAASEAQRLLMVCLLLADELDEERSKPKPDASKGRGDGDSAGDDDDGMLVAAVEHLASRIDHIAASLA